MDEIIRDLEGLIQQAYFIIGKAKGKLQNNDNSGESQTPIPYPRFGTQAEQYEWALQKQLARPARVLYLVRPATQNALPGKKLNPCQDGDKRKEEDLRMLLEIPGVSVDNKPRKDGRYQGRIHVDGKQKSIYGKTKEEVMFKILQVVRGDKPAVKRKKKVTEGYKLHAWLDKWFITYKEPNLKPSSKAHYTGRILRLKKLLPDKKLSELNGLEIQELLMTQKAPASRQDIKSVLNSALNKAVKLGLIKSNPCAAVELPKVAKSKRCALSIEEQAKWLAEIKGTVFEGLFKFLLTTGLRIAEARALTAEDFKDGKVTVNKSAVIVNGKTIFQNSGKTEKAFRSVPVPPETMNALNIPSSGLIFDFTYERIESWFVHTSKKIGIPCSAHVLRHTYATRLDEAGVPPRVKQYLLGHATLVMTENVYTDTKKEFIDQQTSRIIAAFDTKTTPENE